MIHDPSLLTVHSAREGAVHTITLTGELDIASAAEVEVELVGAESSGAAAIVLDLSGLTFMDSTGVRLLIAANARSQTDSDRLTIIPPTGAAMRVIEIAGLADWLPFRS